MTFRDFLESLAIIPPRDLRADEKWHPCGTLTHPKSGNGRYNLSSDEKSGAAQNWSTMQEAAVWRANGKTDKPDPLDNAALTARLARKREEEREAIGRAREYWKGATALVGARNGYLAKKRLGMLGAAGLRVIDDTLLVPMYRGRQLVSVQSIAPDGSKKFFPGCPAKGAVWRIERPRSTVTVACEGVATGLCLFAAIPTCSVVVCFSAGNLVTVAEREDWHGFTVVASDCDHETEKRIGRNPGVEAATKAADAIGCGVAIPTGISGTDFNDMYIERLEEIESLEEFKRFKMSPFKMMSEALNPVRATITQKMVFIKPR